MMKLKHVGSVGCADELRDGGAEIWARTVVAVRERCPGTKLKFDPGHDGNHAPGMPCSLQGRILIQHRNVPRL